MHAQLDFYLSSFHNYNFDFYLQFIGCSRNGGGEFSNGAPSSSGDPFIRASSHQEMPMVQDLGFQWGHGDGYSMVNLNHISSSSSSSHQGLEFHLSKNRSKDELLISNSFAKLAGTNLEDYNTRLPNYMGFEPMNMGISNCRPGSFSIVLPTANISDSSIAQSLYPSSLGMDCPAMDLLASATFGRTLSQPSLNSIPLIREDLAYGLGQLQEQPQAQASSTHHKVSCTLAILTILLAYCCYPTSYTCMNKNSMLLRENNKVERIQMGFCQ